MKGSPADPNRLYASQSSGWFGQIIQRSGDGGKTWEPVGNKFAYDGVPGTHQWYDGTPHPWEFKRVWHLEPSPTIPIPSTRALKTPPCSALPMAARTGMNFRDCAVTAQDRIGSPARVACVCTPSFWIPADSDRIFIAISAAGAFRTDDGAQPGSRSIRDFVSAHSRSHRRSRSCVHHVAMHPARPGVLFMQKHWDVMRSDNAGDCWKEVSGNLPTDFGFVIDVHAHEPETIYVVPIKSDPSTIRPTASCACTGAGPAVTNGSAVQGAAAEATATSTYCATRWR